MRAIGRSETLRLARLDSVQPRYNLLFRQIEREMLPFCHEEGVGVIPYNPIAGGLLSGKRSRSAPPAEGTRFTLGAAAGAYQDRYWHDSEFDTVDELRQLADQAGVNLVTLSVAWVLANEAITAPIIGASRPGQLDSSLAAAELVLDGDLMQRLDDRTHQYRMGDAPGNHRDNSLFAGWREDGLMRRVSFPCQRAVSGRLIRVRCTRPVGSGGGWASPVTPRGPSANTTRPRRWSIAVGSSPPASASHSKKAAPMGHLYCPSDSIRLPGGRGGGAAKRGGWRDTWEG